MDAPRPTGELALMTEQQGAALSFKFHNLPGWGMENWEFRPLHEAAAYRLLTRRDASNLITWLGIMGESPRGSVPYARALYEITILNRTERLLNEYGNQ